MCAGKDGADAEASSSMVLVLELAVCSSERVGNCVSEELPGGFGVASRRDVSAEMVCGTVEGS